MYYWVRYWISYNYESTEIWHSKGEQWEHPAETIYDQNGVCINYVAVLASLYEAAGIDSKVVYIEGGELSSPHAIILINMPNVEKGHYYGGDWLVLDPTNAPKFTSYDPYNPTDYDIKDVE